MTQIEKTLEILNQKEKYNYIYLFDDGNRFSIGRFLSIKELDNIYSLSQKIGMEEYDLYIVIGIKATVFSTEKYDEEIYYYFAEKNLELSAMKENEIISKYEDEIEFNLYKELLELKTALDLSNEQADKINIIEFMKLVNKKVKEVEEKDKSKQQETNTMSKQLGLPVAKNIKIEYVD
jgi:hypothetical protein